MAVTFNGNPGTTTAANGTGKDGVAPSFGSLSAGAMTSPGGLAGTTGNDAKLVTGDQWVKVTGNVTEMTVGSRTCTTTQNVTRTVNGNETYTLKGNRKHTVRGDTVEAKQGRHVHANTGPRTDTHIGPVDRTFQAPTTETHPEEWLKKFEELIHFEKFGYKTGITDVAAVVGKVDIMASLLIVHPIALRVGMEEMSVHEARLKISEQVHKLHVMATKLIITAALIAVLEFGTPFKPNALPRPTPITPFD